MCNSIVSGWTLEVVDVHCVTSCKVFDYVGVRRVSVDSKMTWSDEIETVVSGCSRWNSNGLVVDWGSSGPVSG